MTRLDAPMDMLSTSKGPTRHGQGRSSCAWTSRCWSRVVRCGSGSSGAVGTTRERPCRALFWIWLLGHSLIRRFTRRSNHIHNKIPSYCDLRRHGALVHGDWYVLVSDLSKVLGGTLLCGNCCRQGRAVALNICHGPSVRPSQELQLSSAVHISAISCGARTPSQTSAHLRATGVVAVVTNGHLLERDVKLRRALAAAPDRRQENPRIVAEHTSVSDDLVAKRPLERRRGTPEKHRSR